MTIELWAIHFIIFQSFLKDKMQADEMNGCLKEDIFCQLRPSIYFYFSQPSTKENLFY